LNPQNQLDAVLARKRLTAIKGYSVVTDPLDYAEIDQVFPIYPEQAFFLDEIVRETIQGASVLEVGVGSGVLSIGAVRAGAARVTALEINPRAKNIAGFNIVMNGFEDRIAIVDGAAEVFSPVAGRQFSSMSSRIRPSSRPRRIIHSSITPPPGRSASTSSRRCSRACTTCSSLGAICRSSQPHRGTRPAPSCSRTWPSGT